MTKTFWESYRFWWQASSTDETKSLRACQEHLYAALGRRHLKIDELLYLEGDSDATPE